MVVQHSMKRLIVLMITAFVDIMGVLMIVPLLPFYAVKFGANGIVVGLLFSSFAIAQLMFAPVWGRFSDRFGRRPALLVGLGASVVSYVIFAYANSLWVLFLSRLVQGAGGGTVSVVQAYVADALEPNERAKGLGWLSAATNAGVAIGPVIGSFAAAGGEHMPGLVAALICATNMLFASQYLVESRDMSQAHHARKPSRSREAIVNVVIHPNEPSSRLIWIYAIAMGAFQSVNAVLALFLASRFGVTTKTIGYFFMYIGVIGLITRAGILGSMVDRFGESRLSRFGSTLLAIGLASLPFMHRMTDPAAFAAKFGGILPVDVVKLLPFLPLGLAVGLIPLGTAFTFPCVTAMLSRVISSNERGLYMGVQQTFGGVARVIFPVVAGFLFDRLFALPFLISAVLVAGTIPLGLGLGRIARTQQPAREEPAAAAP